MSTLKHLTLLAAAAGCAETRPPYLRGHDVRYFRLVDPADRQALAHPPQTGAILDVVELNSGAYPTSDTLAMYVLHHPYRTSKVDPRVREADVVVFCYRSLKHADLPHVFPHWTGEVKAFITHEWFALYPAS